MKNQHYLRNGRSKVKGFTALLKKTHQSLLPVLKSKLRFYVPFNSQAHIETGPPHRLLRDSNPHKGDCLWLYTKLANPPGHWRPLLHALKRTKFKVGGLHSVQQPGSYWDRPSTLPFVGLEPTQRWQPVIRCQTCWPTRPPRTSKSYQGQTVLILEANGTSTYNSNK